MGSSPRVRGKPALVPASLEQVGLIPACAGKTSALPLLPVEPPAHPRVCGENLAPFGMADTRLGSSPRVRGKLRSFLLLRSFLRLIPACAGKTPPPRWPYRTRGAHPRVCGENVGTRLKTSRTTGSSPRVRGKPHLTSEDVHYTGLIPACAGKTRPYSPASADTSAHPRVCGENAAGGGKNEFSQGSSPRVRGKRRPAHTVSA